MIHELTVNRETDPKAWAEVRKVAIGGSEIAYISGSAKQGSYYSLWLRKTGQLPQEDNNAMSLGRYLEPWVIKAHNANIENAMKQIVPNDKTFYNDEISGRLFATPDGFIGEEGIAEVKTSNYNFDEWRAGCPDWVYDQCQWNMGILRKKFCRVVIMLGGSTDFIIYDLDFNENDFNKLIEAGENFLDKYLLGNEAPPVTGLDIDYVKYSLRTPKKKVQLDDVASVLVEKWKEIEGKVKQYNEQIKFFDEKKDEIKATLINMIGDAEEGYTPNGFVITAKIQKRNAYQVAPSERLAFTVKEAK